MTTSRNCSSLFITDFWYYLFDILLFLYLDFQFNLLSFTLFFLHIPISPSIKSALLSIHNLSLTNAAEMSGNVNIQSVHPSLAENVGREVSFQPLEICQYSYEKFLIFIFQMKSPMIPLRNNRLCYCKVLSKPMSKQGSDYRLKIMTAFNGMSSAKHVERWIIYWIHTKVQASWKTPLIWLFYTSQPVNLLSTSCQRPVTIGEPQATSASVSLSVYESQ